MHIHICIRMCMCMCICMCVYSTHMCMPSSISMSMSMFMSMFHVVYCCTSAEGVLKERPGPSLVPFLSENGSPAVIEALRALMRDALSVGTASTSPVIFSCGPRGK